MTRYFVTGTDTGVGKTFVTCALARRARALGSTVFAFKPIETGVTGPLGEDQAALVEAAGGWQQGDARGIYQFALPAAPHVAAQAEQRTIDLDLISTVYAGSAGADVVLVEGAGGLRVPVTASVDMAALARRLELPLVIVARATLGTINHSLLTIEAAEREGLSIAALVLSLRLDDDRGFAASNALQIAARWSGRILTLGADPTAVDVLLGPR